MFTSLLLPGSITMKNASDTRRVNTPFPIHILYRYGLSKGMMLNNFRNTVQLKGIFISLPSQWVIKLSGRIKKIYPSVIPPVSVETLQ